MSSVATMGDSSDETDDAFLGEPIFKKTPSQNDNAVEKPESIRKTIAKREERKKEEQSDFLNSIIEKATHRKERNERIRIMKAKEGAAAKGSEKVEKTSKKAVIRRKELLCDLYYHIIFSSAKEIAFFKLSHAILDLLSINMPIEDVDSINTSTIACPSEFGERYHILTKKFDDLLEKVVLTKEAYDRAVKGLDILKWEVNQVLDEDIDKHYTWEW